MKKVLLAFMAITLLAEEPKVTAPPKSANVLTEKERLRWAALKSKIQDANAALLASDLWQALKAAQQEEQAFLSAMAKAHQVVLAGCKEVVGEFDISCPQPASPLQEGAATQAKRNEEAAKSRDLPTPEKK